MQSSNINYIERLDHLRFYAAALVVLFHSQLLLPPRVASDFYPILLVKEGHIGVQLFMAISGFILSLITFNKKLNALKFYLNRVLRIYPLLVFIVFLGYFSTQDPRPTSTTIDFICALLPISNLSRYNYGLFGGQLWSVAVELQFYLLFPVIQAKLLKQGPHYLIGVIFFFILTRTIVFMQNATVHHLSYFSIFGELDVFLLGSLSGWYYANNRFHMQSPAWIIASLVALYGLVAVAFHEQGFYHVGFAAPSPHWLWIIWPDILGIVFCALIPAYIQCKYAIPFSKIIALGGKSSYSIYVWHIAVITLVSNSFIRDYSSLKVGIIVLILTSALSYFSYAVIEAPFLSRRLKYVNEDDRPERQRDVKIDR